MSRTLFGVVVRYAPSARRFVNTLLGADRAVAGVNLATPSGEPTGCDVGRRLLADGTVDRLSDQIHVSVVTCRLLDHVNHHPPQREPRARVTIGHDRQGVEITSDLPDSSSTARAGGGVLLAASGQFPWPPTGRFVTAYGQDLMAADTLRGRDLVGRSERFRTLPRGGGCAGLRDFVSTAVSYAEDVIGRWEWARPTSRSCRPPAPGSSRAGEG
jgi:hypothetical protein